MRRRLFSVAAILVAVSVVPISAAGARPMAGRADSRALTSDLAMAAPTPTPTASPMNVYAATGVGMFTAAVMSIPQRVYVPDEMTGRVVVIDPRTYRIIRRFAVGAKPEHVTPDWDLRRLFVDAALGGRLTVIDPKRNRPIGRHLVPGPYNLYFSLDGRKAIVVLDSRLSGGEYGGARQLYFYNRRTWRLLKSIRIRWAGANHMDFSADGRYALLSLEYSGYLVKVDIARMAVVRAMLIGGSPVDVRLAPDGRVFYNANQRRGGVYLIDPVRMRKVGFIRTGRGAHGLAISRDGTRLYVTNRLAGTISAIDFTTRRVVARWRVGGSPDMISVSADGTRLWVSNRFNGIVTVVDAVSGRVVRRIRVGGHPHGLTFFPQPGRFSLGHNGNYR
jgi:YVTN family beta-propeller protein